LELLELFEVLKGSTEAESKNFFGQYNSKSMASVTGLIKVMEKSNLNLAELGKCLSQLGNFEGYRMAHH
jgi:hypothetical protein